MKTTIVNFKGVSLSEANYDGMTSDGILVTDPLRV